MAPTWGCHELRTKIGICTYRFSHTRKIHFHLIFFFLLISLCTVQYSLTLILSLTSFLVENQFSLEFPPVIQSALDLRRQPVACLWTIQKVARTTLLHQLSASVACQLAEPVRAVHNGVTTVTLGVPQQKVAVCRKRVRGRDYSFQKSNTNVFNNEGISLMPTVHL